MVDDQAGDRRTSVDGPDPRPKHGAGWPRLLVALLGLGLGLGLGCAVGPRGAPEDARAEGLVDPPGDEAAEGRAAEGRAPEDAALDSAAVRRVVEAGEPRVQDCYQAELDRLADLDLGVPPPQGRVLVIFDIASDGTVHDAALFDVGHEYEVENEDEYEVENEDENENEHAKPHPKPERPFFPADIEPGPFERCILEEVSRWHFPPPAAGTAPVGVEVPFHFVPRVDG